MPLGKSNPGALKCILKTIYAAGLKRVNMMQATKSTPAPSAENSSLSLGGQTVHQNE